MIAVKYSFFEKNQFFFAFLFDFPEIRYIFRQVKINTVKGAVQ